MGKVMLLVLVAALFATQTHAAESNSDDAKAHFKRGADLYDEGNFRGALLEFQKAHELLPNFKLLYNIGQVHLQLLDYARAQDSLSRYLKEGGNDVPAARRDEVTKELERLKTRVGKLVITGADGAEVLVDDEPVGYLPLSSPLNANTGRHKVTVISGTKQPQSRVVEVLGLDTATVAFPKDEAPKSDAPTVAATTNTTTTPVATVVTPTAPPAPRSKVPMVVGWAVTGALAITASVFAGLAFKGADDLKVLRNTFGTTLAALNASAAKVSTFATVADLTALGAIVAGGVSLALTVAALSGDQPVTVALGPTSVSLLGRF